MNPTSKILLVCCLLQVTPPPYPFTQADKGWYQTKKIGVVDLRTPGPMRTEFTLDIAKLDEKSVGFVDNRVFKIQIADDNNLMVTPQAMYPSEKELPTLWLANYPTKDLVDDTLVVLTGAIRVVGTKTYETAIGGQRTVRKIEFLKKDESDAIVKKLVDELADFKKAQEDARYFKMKSKAGTEVEAKFVAFSGNKVEIKTKDGRTLKLALEAFEKDTADELRKLIREYRAKK